MPYPKYHNILFGEEELVKGYQLYTNVKNGNFVWLLYLKKFSRLSWCVKQK